MLIRKKYRFKGLYFGRLGHFLAGCGGPEHAKGVIAVAPRYHGLDAIALRLLSRLN
ncbi:hypothetical protein ACT3UJ_15325 [Halomonas sp. 86]|uniref:hypothetical protein n=1 Tax=Halomonas TaxID=2745 RepID=UPI001552BD80|nr:hypothetical protein [Halomonas hibernica]